MTKITKSYTGVGSRETPDKVADLMEDIAFCLALRGWNGRSGSAPAKEFKLGFRSADLAFEAGYMRALKFSSTLSSGFTGYLPWEGFNGFSSDLYHTSKGDISGAISIVSKLHPAWDLKRVDKYGVEKPILSRPVKSLHIRNVFQVLGGNLNSPSHGCILYAKPTKGGVKGGTNTAYMLARQNGVPVSNLYIEDEFFKWRDWCDHELTLHNIR